MFSSWNDTTSCCMAVTKSIHIVDFFLLMVAVVLYAIYMRILYNTKAVHANLKPILVVISTLNAAILLVRITDFLDFSGHYDFGPTPQNSIKSICFSMRTLSLFNLLAERTFALYAYRRYDRPEYARPRTIIMAFLLQFIFVVVSYSMIQNGGASAAQLYVGALNFCGAIIILVATVIFVASSRLRQNSVRKERFDLTRHSIALNDDQSVQNRRSDRFIIIFILFQVFSFFFTAIFGSILMFQVFRSDPRNYLLCNAIGYLTLTPRVIMSMLIPLILQPSLYKEFTQMISLRKYNGRAERQSELCSSEAEQVIIKACGENSLVIFTKKESDI